MSDAPSDNAGDILAPEQAARRFDALHATGALSDLHGVLILRRGTTVLERYFPGRDRSWGQDRGVVAHGPDTRHDLRSVTKSVVGLLYGIALADGSVPAPEAALLARFPQYPDLAADPARQNITVRHALTMTLGLHWDESAPYTSAANSEIAMEQAPDRLRFCLNRAVLGPPGTGWTYSGGALALLGHLIERGTGQDLHDFARSRLLEPLGIACSEWLRGRDGVASAASGLRLTLRDLARIGECVAQGGAWDGRAVVPESWLAESHRPAAVVDDLRRYGFLWYLGTFALPGPTGMRGEAFCSAVGNGGQRLFVVPGRDAVLAMTAGAYDDPDGWRAPTAVLQKVFLAGLSG